MDNLDPKDLAHTTLQAGMALAEQLIQSRDDIYKRTGNSFMADVFVFNTALEALIFVSTVYLRSTGKVGVEKGEAVDHLWNDVRTKFHEAVGAVMGKYTSIKMLTVLPEQEKGDAS